MGLKHISDIRKKLEQTNNTELGALHMSTGYRELDQALGGFQRGQVYLLGASVYMDKRLLAMNMVSNMLKEQKLCILWFSLALSACESVKKMMEIQSRTKLPEDANLYIEDGPGMTTKDFFKTCNQMSQKPDLIVIDELSYMADYLDDEARMAKEIEALAVKEDCAVLVLTNVSDAVEERDDSHPLVCDFTNRELLKKASAIFTMYNEEFYIGEETNHKGTVEINVLYAKDGRRGKVFLAYLEDFHLFCSLQV